MFDIFILMLRQERRFEKIVADKFTSMKKKKHDIFSDIILDHSPAYRKLEIAAQKRRLVQMAIGCLWHERVALYYNMICLPCKEYPKPTADVYNTATETFIEIKNHEQTMNSASLLGTLKKMGIQMDRYESNGVIGFINAKKQEGRVCVKISDCHEITCYYGDAFLEYIFGDEADRVVNHFRDTVLPLVEDFCTL